MLLRRKDFIGDTALERIFLPRMHEWFLFSHRFHGFSQMIANIFFIKVDESALSVKSA